MQEDGQSLMRHVRRKKKIEKNLNLHKEYYLYLCVYGIMMEIKEKTKKTNKDKKGK